MTELKEAMQQLLILKGLLSDMDKDDQELVNSVREEIRETLNSFPTAGCSEVFMGLAIEYLQYSIDNAKELV